MPQIRIMLHGLQCRGINRNAAVLKHRGHQEHVGAFLGLVSNRTIGRTLTGKHAGANGRKLSLNLILRFIAACMAGERGSPRDALAREGPGAEFHPALEPTDDFTVGQESGDMV